ncbi:thioredoxin family protein [soil metagenome]
MSGRPSYLVALVRAASLAGASFAAQAAEGSSATASTDHLKSRLVASQDAAVPGDTLRVGLLLEHDPHWHTYWKNPGDSGLPTTITFELPPEIKAGDIEWPLPERLPVADLMNFGYNGTTLLPVDLQIPAGYKGGEIAIKAHAEWLVCERECIPGSADYSFTLPVRTGAAVIPEFDAAFRQSASRAPVSVPDTSARFSVDGDDIVVRFEGAGWPSDLRTWNLFPATKEVIANAVPVRWDEPASGQPTTARVARNEYFAGAPEQFDLLMTKGTWGIEVAAARVGGTGAPAGAGTPAPAAAAKTPAAAPEAENFNLGIALVFAVLGGLVLNLMPCVFPVLFIKAAAALESAHDTPRLRRHSLLYTAGVVASFIAIAAVLLALGGSGAALGWGFQLQDPWFVAVLVLLMFVMALSFAGLIEIGAGFAGVGQKLTEGNGNASAFFTGVLACVVASPCTAPYMGAALGYALTQPPAAALAVFASLGLGMAIPMLALGFMPRLAKLLPRPGAWMATFRQFLAFPMFLTAAWLLWVYGQQTSVTGMWQLLSAMIGVAFAFWLFHQVSSLRQRSRANAGRAVAVLALVAAVAWPIVSPPPLASSELAAGPNQAQPYSEATLASLRAGGKPVLVNMTAAWCITCLANERVALSKDDVVAELKAKNVAYLKGDWTRRDPAITKYLESFGRSGVPLYVLYPGKGAEPVVLPQLLTPAVVTEALAQNP